MERWIKDIQERSQTGKPPIRGGRSAIFDELKFDDLIFLPSLLTKRPLDYFREDIVSEVTIGKSAAKPLKLKTPIMIGAMSFGALSKEAKIALAKGSTMAGTVANTGEGGMLPEERDAANILIVQYSTGRFGINEDVLCSADAVEIKIAQGAKPGQGGLLPAAKMGEEIAKIRNVPVTEDLHSPPYHPDIQSAEDLRRKVDWIREVTEGKPVIIKLGAGHLEQDIKIAVEAGPDVIAIDGMGGSTAAAPTLMLDHFGIPTVAMIPRARRMLDILEAEQELIVGGGLNKGADMAKALALGADAVFIATSALVAMGCVYCLKCHTGKCPAGLATHDPDKKLDVDAGAVKVGNFIKACTEEIKMVAAALGKESVSEIEESDLRSLSPSLSRITGVPLV